MIQTKGRLRAGLLFARSGRRRPPPLQCRAVSASDTRWGWTAGAGVEDTFAANWSAKLEYNYIDLGKVAPIQYTPAINDRSEWKDTFHTVKLGINYHFNAPSPVVSAKY
ncbi:outer membrane protein [Bradyrhizobium sp. Pha-3]|uniref:outer membrane protein n=1 Tax=Bradyrhizobium sp. Pha-3 TaxID=208375 RepID=UPI0035D4EFE0